MFKLILAIMFLFSCGKQQNPSEKRDQRNTEFNNHDNNDEGDNEEADKVDDEDNDESDDDEEDDEDEDVQAKIESSKKRSVAELIKSVKRRLAYDKITDQILASDLRENEDELFYEVMQHPKYDELLFVLLVKGVNIEKVDLSKIVKKEKIDLVKYLQSQSQSFSRLESIISSSGNLTIGDIFKELNIQNINQKDRKTGFTPLVSACGLGKNSLVLEILKLGADINIICNEGKLSKTIALISALYNPRISDDTLIELITKYYNAINIFEEMSYIVLNILISNRVEVLKEFYKKNKSSIGYREFNKEEFIFIILKKLIILEKIDMMKSFIDLDQEEIKKVLRKMIPKSFQNVAINEEIIKLAE